MTDFPLSGLRSVDLDTPDLSRAVDFYTQVWGLQLVERTSEAAWLRGSGRDHHVLALHLGEAPAIRCMTFRVVARSALERLARSVTAAGGRVVDRFEAGDPAGGEVLAVEDLCGRRIHLVHGDDDRSPDRPVPGRVERLAHVNINSPDVDADARFFEQGLGFKLTDRSKLMAFVRTNSDHHSIVIAEAPAPTLNHVAFQQPTWEGVMRAAGRLVDHGFPSPGASDVMAPATTFSLISSTRSGSWSSIRPRSCRSTTTIVFAGLTSGCGLRDEPINGVSRLQRARPVRRRSSLFLSRAPPNRVDSRNPE